MPVARSQPADTVAKIHPVIPALTLYGPIVYCEYHGISLTERNDLGLRLHPRPLLGKHKFAASEIPAWL